jgi:hypothetical protein
MNVPDNDPRDQAGDRIQVPITITIHPAEGGGFWAEFPALPKVYAEAETVEELRERAADVVRSYLDCRFIVLILLFTPSIGPLVIRAS